jgi:hypothetical protein
MVALLRMPRIDSGESWAERRMFERTSAEGVAQGHRLDHTVQARRNPRIAMNLRDLSLGGLAAVAKDPLERGESVAVTFPQRGLGPAINAIGRVIRCEPSPYGYQVAIEFEPLLAA